MEIIVNADDFGLTKGVNKGIIDAHLNGVVTRTTLIMNGYAVEEAVDLAKRTTSLKTGIHLALTFGRPLNKEETLDLVDENGTFKYTSIESTLTDTEIKQVRKEWQTQIEAFQKTGLKLDHIDSHHHVHGWSDLKEVILELSNHYKVPIRYIDSLRDNPGNTLTEYLWLSFYKDGIQPNLLEEVMKLPYKSIEVMTHPAVVDEDLESISGYTFFREKETALLKNMSPVEGMRFI